MYALLLLLASSPGQFVDSADFPKPAQTAALEATVRVLHSATRGEGSGVVVGYEAGVAYVLTAAHCVPDGPGGDAVELFFFVAETWPTPKRKVETASVRQRMPDDDLAVITAAMAQPPPAILKLTPPYALKDEPRFPFPVLSVGCETNGAPACRFDRVTGNRAVSKPDGTRGVFWEAGTPPLIGRSGGPLVDRRGCVIGICSGTKDGKGYYTNARHMLKALERGYAFLIRPAGDK